MILRIYAKKKSKGKADSTLANTEALNNTNDIKLKTNFFIFISCLFYFINLITNIFYISYKFIYPKANHH